MCISLPGASLVPPRTPRLGPSAPCGQQKTSRVLIQIHNVPPAILKGAHKEAWDQVKGCREAPRRHQGGSLFSFAWWDWGPSCALVHYWCLLGPSLVHPWCLLGASLVPPCNDGDDHEATDDALLPLLEFLVSVPSSLLLLQSSIFHLPSARPGGSWSD